MVTKPPPDSQNRVNQEQSSRGWLSPLLVVIFRLLLLGVGSVSALLVGIAVATVSPGEVETQPPLEKVFQVLSDFR
jgi:hypothetical protein